MGACDAHSIIPAPFDVYRDVVRPEWIDHNGHMNMGYYLVAFDLATDEWLRYVGLDEAYREAHRVTTFCLEAPPTTGGWAAIRRDGRWAATSSPGSPCSMSGAGSPGPRRRR